MRMNGSANPIEQAPPPEELRRRWRLILGDQAETAAGAPGAPLSPADLEIDQALGFLFDREYERDPDTYRDRTGGGGRSRLTTPRWLSNLRSLFPRSTAETLMRLALDRYGLTGVLADETLVETIEPDIPLLRALLATKGVVPGSVLGAVRRLVRRVADQLAERLRVQVLSCFTGARNRAQRSRTAVAKNFDPWTTIRRNLKHYQTESQSLVIERAYFHSRLQRRSPWDLLLVVDQSGSMADSVIHSAVLAGIFCSLPMLRSRLVLFDTAVVDLTEHASDPVEVLMRVQLGGGTDIAGALEYAASWVRNPRRTLLVLVSDFFEGGSPDDLYASAGRLVESGVTCLGLAALDERAEPAFERMVAGRLARLGFEIAAMTPDRLAEWVARIVRG